MSHSQSKQALSLSTEAVNLNKEVACQGLVDLVQSKQVYSLPLYYVYQPVQNRKRICVPRLTDHTQSKQAKRTLYLCTSQ